MPHGPLHGDVYQLAQLNVAKLAYAKDSPELEEFINSLEAINKIAEESDGFVWRNQDENGNGMSFEIFDEMTLPNMSVWRDRDSLFDYVYQSAHTHYLARRKEWFKMPKEAHMVFWWVAAGHEPTLEEAAERLTYLRENGPTPYAFTFKKAFEAQEAVAFASL